MFVTMVEAQVDSGREPDLLTAWRESTTEGDLPPGLIESSLLRADGDRWRIVTVWESREAVLAMRERGRPAAIVMFERAGARPEVSMWDVEERISLPGLGGLQETRRR